MKLADIAHRLGLKHSNVFALRSIDILAASVAERSSPELLFRPSQVHVDNFAVELQAFLEECIGESLPWMQVDEFSDHLSVQSEGREPLREFNRKGLHRSATRQRTGKLWRDRVR